jgi:hypothetical protein
MLMAFARTIPGFPVQFRNLYIGLNDGSYYGIYNCEWPDYVESCKGAGENGKDVKWFFLFLVAKFQLFIFFRYTIQLSLGLPTSKMCTYLVTALTAEETNVLWLMMVL